MFALSLCYLDQEMPVYLSAKDANVSLATPYNALDLSLKMTLFWEIDSPGNNTNTKSRSISVSSEAVFDSG